MNLSKNLYNRSASIMDNPDSLQSLHTLIQDLNKTDVIAYFPSLSISDERIYFLPTTGNGVYHSNTVLKSGYQSLLRRISVPYKLVSDTSPWIELPLVNGKIIELAQKSHQQDVFIRMINNEIRAILSSSYTTVDDQEIVTLLENSFLTRLSSINFSCNSTSSNTKIITRDQSSWSYGNYTVSMFLYVSNSEIGDASVRCGIGITIVNTATPERFLGFELSRDTRTLGRVIHRGVAIRKLEKELNNLFDTASTNWNLIQDALVTMSNVNVENLSGIEEKMIKALKLMPEFEAWKTQYDAMRSSSIITNMFDLIYLMTSIPYRDEYFNSIVEEIIFGRFF
jgi:hypothetical protein